MMLSFFLVGLIVTILWVALGVGLACLWDWDPEKRSRRVIRLVLVVLIIAELTNSGTFALVRGVLGFGTYDGPPKLETLNGVGIYQSDEVHYLIAGEQTRPEDMLAILPDGLHGTIKAVRYQQFQYTAYGIANELSRDVIRNGYDKVTIWAIGSGALAAHAAMSKSGLNNLEIVLIDPCPSTLVIQPDMQKTVTRGIPWQRVWIYIKGWFSLIPDANGQSDNLRTMQEYNLAEEAESAIRPSTKNIIGLVVSEKDEYLQINALKGLYANAIQVSVSATHGDIVNSREQYQRALEELWTQHLVETEQIEVEDDPYTGPFPSDPT